MTTPVLAPLEFYPALLNPAASGLYGATTWSEASGPSRFLSAGVRIRPNGNYGGVDAFGVWEADWCTPPGSGEDALKTGTRPDPETEPFLPVTVWAYDECDATPASRAEIQQRVQQILRLEEQTAVEHEFAARLLADSVSESLDVPVKTTYHDAVGYLEGELARTNTVGVIHASAALATPLAKEAVIINPGGTGPRSVLGHRFVFGGGYVDLLGSVMIATSVVYGWRDAVQVRPVLDQQSNTYAAVAERSVVVGYEKIIAAVEISAAPE